jgi:hypothetical protein
MTNTPQQKCCVFLKRVFANAISKGGLNAHLQHSIYMRFSRGPKYRA